jgi:solute carrier family 31 (copper transporter), member 1
MQISIACLSNILILIMIWSLDSSYSVIGCPTNSQDGSCASFTLSPSNSSQQTTSICAQTPNLLGCELIKQCKNGRTAPNCAAVADSFAMYATLCTDSPGSNNCHTFQSMCGSNPTTSKIQQCQTSPPLKFLPKTQDVIRDLYSICSSSMSSMVACSQCKTQITSADQSPSTIKSGTDSGGCNIMNAYSQLCTEMPSMSHCSLYKQMCSQEPNSIFCSQYEFPLQGGDQSANGNVIGSGMLMYFHTTLGDTVLVEGWVASTPGQYAGAWFFTFALGMLFELLSALTQVWEIKIRYAYKMKQVKHEQQDHTDGKDNSKSSQLWSHLAGCSAESMGKRDAVFRGIFRVFTAGVAYLLMLIAMTYNVGLFFGVIMGLGTGAWLFRPFAIGFGNKLRIFSMQAEEDVCIC